MNQFQQTQELHEQCTQQQNLYSHSQSAFSFQSVQHQDFHQVNSTASWSAASQSVTSQSVITVSEAAALSSSSIIKKENADNVIKKFFKWMIMKIQHQNKRDRLEFAMIKTLKQDWSISDLKTMRDAHSSLYDLAVRELQISDGLACSFKEELERYKNFCCQTKTKSAAGALADLWNQGQDLEGGFLFE